MAYNSQLYQPVPINPVQPYYPTGIQMQQMMPQTQQLSFPNMNNIAYTLTAAYTQGEIGARSYPVATGNTVVLLDSDTIDTDSPIIYIKTTGYDGKPLSIKKIEGKVSYPNEQGLFSSSVQEVKHAEIDLSEYVKKEDIESYQQKIDNITERLDSFDGTINSLNENISNIDNRFTSMFSAFNPNGTSNNSGKNTANNNNNQKK